MEIGKEESNVQNAQLSMQELYGKTQEPPHKKVPLTENMQYSDRERIHAYWLSRVDGIGAVTAAKLYESCGSFEGIYERVLYNRKKLDPFICSFLGKAVKKGLEEAVLLFKQRVEEYDRLEEQGVRFILCGEAAYPKRLMHIYDKPMWLFVRGMLPEDAKPSAAVIGARSCTPYGRQEAEYFGRILAENGVQVVSGMALGIDQAGHKGAMDGGGLTYAVMGCGIDTCYPPSGIRLHARIREQGGILSEYGPGVPPTASHFPIRNRIISGLSDLVLVVEARKRSGSLITADLALDEETGMIDVNCRALTAVTRLVLPYMSENSRILQFASAAAFLPQPRFAVYAATKAFVLSYSRALAMELKPRQICVTAVCPGPVKTEFFDIAETTGEIPLYKRLVMADPKKVVKRRCATA